MNVTLSAGSNKVNALELLCCDIVHNLFGVSWMKYESNKQEFSIFDALSIA